MALTSLTLHEVLSVLLTWTEIKKVQIAAYDGDFELKSRLALKKYVSSPYQENMIHFIWMNFMC